MLSTIFELHCLPGNSNLIWYHVNLIKVKMTCNMFVNAQLVKMQILLKRFFLVNCKSTEKFFRNLIILSTTNWMNSISLHEPVSYSIPHQEQSLFILETSEWLFLSHQIICTHQHSDALIGSLFLPDSCYCKTSMYTHTLLSLHCITFCTYFSQVVTGDISLTWLVSPQRQFSFGDVWSYIILWSKCLTSGRTRTLQMLLCSTESSWVNKFRPWI